MMRCKSEVIEAIKLGRHVDIYEMMFCKKIADAYGCKPLNNEKDNFYIFLGTIYHYGKIQGTRQERSKRGSMREKFT